jgi:hypothetical protein
LKKILIILLTINAVYSAEKRNRIAVIDTGISYDRIPSVYLCENGDKDITGHTIEDIIGHGTAVTEIISNYMNKNKFCINNIKYYHNRGKSSEIIQSLKYVLTLDNVKIINISASGIGHDVNEENTLKRALEMGILVSVAAGNERKDLSKNCDIYPACYNIKHPNYYVVGSCDKNGNPHHFSNYGGPINVCYDGSKYKANNSYYTGTSMSTAINTGKLAK